MWQNEGEGGGEAIYVEEGKEGRRMRGGGEALGVCVLTRRRLREWQRYVRKKLTTEGRIRKGKEKMQRLCMEEKRKGKHNQTVI